MDTEQKGLKGDKVNAPSVFIKNITVNDQTLLPLTNNSIVVFTGANNTGKSQVLRDIHNQLSAIMNFACRFYGLRENPAKQCGAMGKKQAETMRFWTLKEFTEFEKIISNDLLSIPFSAYCFGQECVRANCLH